MRKASFLATVLLIFSSLVAVAQDNAPEMADTMRSNGKIYVVVLVLATIFAGIIAYLIRMERKIKKLEQQ